MKEAAEQEEFRKFFLTNFVEPGDSELRIFAAFIFEVAIGTSIVLMMDTDGTAMRFACNLQIAE